MGRQHQCARTGQAEAGFDLAAAQYQATVLAAFRNVADTLEALKADTAALYEAFGGGWWNQTIPTADEESARR